MDTAFIIGNGESRNIFPIEQLKGHGEVWGCNAIYRDHPLLCDHIVAVIGYGEAVISNEAPKLELWIFLKTGEVVVPQSCWRRNQE